MNAQTEPLDIGKWKRRKGLPLPVPTIFDFAGRSDIQDGDRVTITYDNRQWRGIVVKHGDGWRFIENIE